VQHVIKEVIRRDDAQESVGDFLRRVREELGG
jgi:hypothetical protein